MLAELRSKSQLTLPKQIVIDAGLTEGDQIDITVQDGIIYLVPVAVYPKSYINSLQEEITELKRKLKSGEQKSFSNIDDFLADLEA